MSTPTVVLAGLGEIGHIRAFLALGAVVVIAPDDEVLNTWMLERLMTASPHACTKEVDGLSIQSLARRVLFGGESLPLTELEYRVLVFLASDPERARSFQEIRKAAWGESPDLPDDVFSVRSAIQRLRRKLLDSGVPVAIESVRAFGFRLIKTSSGVRDDGPDVSTSNAAVDQNRPGSLGAAEREPYGVERAITGER
jgi:DNA-binding winged helix-turn-helix (wHTH) protein